MDVSLSQSVHTTLGATQRISSLLDKSQARIATGKKHQSSIDNPIAVSIANSLSNRAADLLVIKDNISQGASRLKTSLNGLNTIDKALDQLKAVAQQHAATDDVAKKAELSNQFNVLKQQLDNFARDSSYGGTNLISASPDDLTIGLNEDGTSSVTVNGVAIDATTLGVVVTDAASIDAAKAQIRSTAQIIGSKAGVTEIREDFTDELVNRLQAGEAKLTQTDLNEEAANVLSLQTRSQLAAAATGIAAQSERTILQLF
jgi:flagellin